MYNIRQIKDSEIEVLAEIFAISFSTADKEKPWDVEHAKNYLLYLLEKQPDMFLGAFTTEGKIIGATGVIIKPWRTGVRCSDGVLFVDVNYQKQGVATLLMKEVLTKAIEKYNTISVEAITFAGADFPLSWYKEIGLYPDEHAVLIKGDCKNILEILHNL